jgi:Amt family ammonium transporter
MTDHWLMLGVAALLLRMGFALYAAGIVRSKNTISALFRSMVEIAVGFLAFCMVGERFLWGSGNISSQLKPESLFLGGIFLIGPAVVSGAALERSKVVLGIVAAVVMAGIITPIIWKVPQWAWFRDRGLVDQAGAIAIHVSAGFAALAAAIALGPRVGKYNRDGSTNAMLGHNHPVAIIGIFLILATWIPYVAGLDGDHAITAALNAMLAASAGVVGSAIYSSIRYGRQDVFLVYAGMMGSLVAISAGAGLFDPAMAAAIGFVSGMVVPYLVVSIDMIWKIDDPAGGITIHGLAGILGVIAAAFLLPAGNSGYRFDRLEAALAALAIVGIGTFCVTAVIFFALRATVGIRVREADEFDGLDLAEYDLNAYPDFQQTTIKSYHLREM